MGAVLAERPGWRPDRPVSEYLRDLQATGRPATTQRSYSFALLRWFRFSWAVGVSWDQATRVEARDFCRHLQLPVRPGLAWDAAGSPSGKYAPSTAAHCETVCRSFYAYHLEAGTGPIVNPFPLARGGRAHAHHNPMEPYRDEHSGLYRPRMPDRIPRSIPEFLVVSRTAISTRSSPGCRRTGTGRWSPFMCRPGRGPLSCCRRPWLASTRGGS